MSALAGCVGFRRRAMVWAIASRVDAMVSPAS
jgi:hypothetical protein